MVTVAQSCDSPQTVYLRVVTFKKKKKKSWGVVAHTFSLNTWEFEASRQISVSSGPT